MNKEISKRENAKQTKKKATRGCCCCSTWSCYSPKTEGESRELNIRVVYAAGQKQPPPSAFRPKRLNPNDERLADKTANVYKCTDTFQSRVENIHDNNHTKEIFKFKKVKEELGKKQFQSTVSCCRDTMKSQKEKK